jgi:hypothetical protein
MTTFVALGDSITLGFGLPDALAHPPRWSRRAPPWPRRDHRPQGVLSPGPGAAPPALSFA